MGFPFLVGKQIEMSIFGWEANSIVHFWLGSKLDSPLLVGKQNGTCDFASHSKTDSSCRFFHVWSIRALEFSGGSTTLRRDDHVGLRSEGVVNRSLEIFRAKFDSLVLLPNQKWTFMFASGKISPTSWCNEFGTWTLRGLLCTILVMKIVL
jgi:hypothetical protein